MVLQLLDIFGVFVFAVSGALVAVRKEMDVFGMFVLAFLPAVGGGTLRDLILDMPVFWVAETSYLFAVGAAVLAVFFGYRLISDGSRLLTWMDATGLAVFCVLGCQKALGAGVGNVVAVMMGVITAVAGGIIRDVVANDIPYVLKQEIYATAALFGALAYVVLNTNVGALSVWIAIVIALLVRAAGIIWGLSLPALHHRKG